MMRRALLVFLVPALVAAGNGGSTADFAVSLIMACVFIPLFVLIDVVLHAVAWQNGGSARPRLAKCHAFAEVCAVVGFAIVLMAGSSKSFVYVGEWDSGAAASATAQLPAYMAGGYDAAADHKYTNSMIGFGSFEVLCIGTGNDKKFGCAVDHVFSAVVPPEPPTRFDDYTAAMQHTPLTKICGASSDAKHADSRNSYGLKNTPHLYGWWNSPMNRAQARVLKALCGGRFRGSKNMLICVGFVMLAHWALIFLVGRGVASGKLSCNLAYGVAVYCAAAGVGAVLSYGNWANFKDVVEEAYPFRSVDFGYAHAMLVAGAAFLFLAAVFAVLLAETARQADARSAGGFASVPSRTVAPTPARAPQQEMVPPPKFEQQPVQPVQPVAMVVGIAQPQGEVLLGAPVMAQGQVLTGSVVSVSTEQYGEGTQGENRPGGGGRAAAAAGERARAAAGRAAAAAAGVFARR